MLAMSQFLVFFRIFNKETLAPNAGGAMRCSAPLSEEWSIQLRFCADSHEKRIRVAKRASAGANYLRYL